MIKFYLRDSFVKLYKQKIASKSLIFFLTMMAIGFFVFGHVSHAQQADETTNVDDEEDLCESTAAYCKAIEDCAQIPHDVGDRILTYDEAYEDCENGLQRYYKDTCGLLAWMQQVYTCPLEDRGCEERGRQAAAAYSNPPQCKMTVKGNSLDQNISSDIDFTPLKCVKNIANNITNEKKLLAQMPVIKREKYFMPPFISTVSAQEMEPVSEEALRGQMAKSQERLSEITTLYKKAKAIEEYLFEQMKFAEGEEKTALKDELSEAYNERRSYQSEYYGAQAEHDKLVQQFKEAENISIKEKRTKTEKQFMARLRDNIERQDKERAAAEARLVDRQNFAEFQQKKYYGEIPQNICYDETECRAGEKKTESYYCTYLSLNKNPIFYKNNPYVLSDEDMQGMREVYNYIGAATFAATMAINPSKAEVAKFVIGEVVGQIVGVPVPTGLDRTDIFGTYGYLGSEMLGKIQKMQNKLSLVYKIDIPVTIVTTYTEEIYTSKEDGMCYAVEWEKNVVPRVVNKEISTVTFVCDAVAKRTTTSLEDYSSTFSFQNTEENETLRYNCQPQKNTEAFAETMKNISNEALRIIRNDYGVANSDQCPPQNL